MTKIPFKAVAVDMDGTFMTDDLTYDHARFEKVLTKLKANGIHFIVSSGRPLPRLKRDFKEYLDRIDMISDNGAILVQDNQIISSHILTKNAGRRLLAFLQKEYPGARICVSGKLASYYLADQPTDFKRLMRYYYPDVVPLVNFDNMPDDERIIKVTLNCPAEWADEIENRFNKDYTERIHCTTSGFDDIDIVPYGVNKAQAIKYFLRYFKVDPSELIAFGDGLNDTEMLKLAGYSYAMANGNPAIIKLAKYKAPSNNDDGVLQVLEDYLK